MMCFPFLLLFLIIGSIRSIIKTKNNFKKLNQIRNLDISSDNEFTINNINKTIIIGDTGCSFITNSIDETGQLFFQSTKESSKYRYVYSLTNNGRAYFNGNPIKIYSFINAVDSYTGNSITIISNNQQYLLSIVYDDKFFEILDLTSTSLNNNLYLSSLLAVPNLIYIGSYINSLFKLKNEKNTFIFAFYNVYKKVSLVNGYRIVLFKGSLIVTSGLFVYNVNIKKIFDIENFSYSFNCFETTNYINCIYINDNRLTTIGILTKNLDLLSNFKLENAVKSDNQNNFRKGIFLKDETCAYIFFENNEIKPLFLIKNLTYDETNGYKLNSALENAQYLILNLQEDVENNCDLNDIIKINDNRIAFISTKSDKQNIILLLIDLFNNYKNFIIRKYIINLDGYEMYSNLRLFLFKNFIGFSNCYGTKENCGFRILNYANTTDYEKIDDFLLNLDIVNPLDLKTNIEIENNLFDYKYTGIKIISIPNKENTRLSIIRTKNLEEINKNDILKKSLIIFSYIGNETIKNGDYIIEFAPIVSEKTYEEFNSIPEVLIYGKSDDAELEFVSLDYMGRNGHFVFNLQHHDDFKCHGNCYSCYKSYISDNEQYCIKCINNYYFIENTENCFKDPIGYYLNPEKNVYSSCHPLCAYCISKEITSTYMNCLSCRNDNYKYYPKNKNCLNCPKYVNYEQTECLDEIPQKFFLYDSNLGIIEKCHELCSKCSNGPTSRSMNCDYCIDGYYLKIDNNNNKNCFPNNENIENNYFQKDLDKNIFYECYQLCGSCDNFGTLTNMNCLTCIDETKYEYEQSGKYCFLSIYCNNSYYYILDENNLKSKICVQEGEYCPEILPYEKIETKECILTCEYEDLINLICKPSNIKAGIEQVKNTFETEIEINDEMVNDILNNKFEDVTIYGNNITYEITTTTNQENKIKQKMFDAISNINLGECEKIIKKENNINPNISLIIIKDDLKRNETISTQVEYEVIDPVTRKVLNLTSCKNTTIKINVPLDIDDKSLDLYRHAKEQGYDIFDSESDFYNDICTVYTSERGTDMILSDRRSDILNNTPKFCEDGCKYSGMIVESRKVICECAPKNFINLNSSEMVFSIELLEDIFFRFNGINYKILGCGKLLLNKKNIVHNLGFYIMSFMIIVFFILIPINLIYGAYQLKLKCYKLIKDKQNMGAKKQEQNKVKIGNSKEELNNILSNSELKKSKNIYDFKRNKIAKFPKRKSIKIGQDNNQKLKRLSLKCNNIIINNINSINRSHLDNNINKSHSNNIDNKNYIDNNDKNIININKENINDTNNVSNIYTNNINKENNNNNNLSNSINTSIINNSSNFENIKNSTSNNNENLKRKFEKQKTLDMRNINILNFQNQKIKNSRNSIIKRYSISKLDMMNNLGSIDLTKKSTDSLTPLSSALLKNNNIDINNKIGNNIHINLNKKKTRKKNRNSTKRKKKTNRIDIISEKPENEEEDNEAKDDQELYFENCLKYLSEGEILKYLDEEELNQMEYRFALKIDKRDFTQYYLSLIKKKQLILFTFFSRNDYNINIVKFSLFISAFSVYFMANTFFFNDKSMHKIYEENGSYNFIYQLPQIVYSTLISSVISFIMRYLSLSEKGIIKIKQLSKISKMVNQTFIMVKSFRLKLIIFNVLGSITLVFAGYYITMFCSVYTNTQIHLLKDTISSFGLTLFYPFGLYLIPGIFRIPSLKSHDKNKICLYRTSQMISLI